MLKTYAKNGIGTDYYVGDIHGCYSKLMEALDEVNFDKTKDRLISVGDIIDRGVESFKMLELLDEPWFITTRGNHEQLIISAIAYNNNVDRRVWMDNGGGDWWFTLTPEQREIVEKVYIPKLQQLPYVIDIGGIYVLHAEYFGSVDDLYSDQVILSSPQILWGRSRIDKLNKEPVKNCIALVVGHTPVQTPTVLGNTVYIDTGAVHRKERKFTLLTTNDVFRLVTNPKTI